MSEAQEPNLENYLSFNDFFVRALKPEARPMATEENGIVCPVDGTVSQIGKITQENIFQAKGYEYNLISLLGGAEQRANPFINGNFATLYLAPKNYHRVHAPLDGQLIEMIHVPGRLFSVNPLTVSHVPNLFTRNERVICLFNTAVGPMAVILVGAMLVGSIETLWAGEVTPPHRYRVQQWNYSDKSIHLEKGEELGRFKFGSTVIVLFGPNKVQWITHISPNQAVKMGQLLGTSKTNE